ncbi:MAG: DEAD/DEAH box helicase [Treponema sp.]|jgi:ATP-dependent RNA helicase RhlB|nr:DEAD/DEAH box helicase [Treponema sp.]
MEFKNFGLHPDLQRGLDDAGYINCMPVQEQVLTNAFSKQDNSQDNQAARDLYVQSQTGTGKTAAFLTVIFQRLLTEELLAKRKALIMTPTRELAVQIEEEAKMLGKYLPFKIGSFYGGVGYAQQEKLLRENAQILVGTPGRVLDLNKSGKMNLMDIAFLVLDEADRMFDMGFYPDLRKLIKVVPSVDKRQTMLFSATLNAWVKNLAWEYTKSPFEIEIKPEIVTVEEITQILYHVPSVEKMQLLLGILKREQPDSAIIFCNTKKYTEIVAKRLHLNGIDSKFIIGDLPQVKRLKVIDDLKAGKTKILVATDVAARGLDIEGLSMVINYDLPVEAENYVHRIGRTARAGKTGKAITLSSEQDVYELPAIERYIGKKIPSEIAMQDLYEEDKSAGKRIETEFSSRYTGDEDGRSSERRSSDRRPRSASGGNRRDGKVVPSERVPSERVPSERRPLDRRPTERRPQEDRQPPSAQKPGRKPYTANRKPQTTSGEIRIVNNIDGQDLSQLSMEERMALYKKKYAAPGVTNNSNKQKQKHRQGKKPKTDNQVKKPQEETAPVKKGFISKLKGLFKKR